jgi:phosphatidylserine/phosphatidylglycerophosphate/cardiolipin synthase-like enzyme
MAPDAAGAGPLPAITHLPLEILRAGRNCWRVEPAARAAVLTNGSYFRALAECLKAAQRQIILIDWDLDARLVLDPGGRGPESLPLHELLRALLEARPALELRCLVWRRPLLYGANRNARPWLEWLRRRCRRFDFRLVPAPLGRCHHQKLVAIDDRLAFAGGIDLCAGRWDRHEHAAHDPARRTPDGEPYGPVRDLQMVVDGAAAAALGELARDHWRRAAGETLRGAAAVGAAPWPAEAAPDFNAVSVGIARTAPDEPAGPVREIEALTRDAVRAARHTIYIEAQYLAARLVGDVLEERLREPDGPAVVAIVTRRSRGLLERLAMGSNRDRLLRRLRAADRHARLRVYYPCVDRGVEMKIHSKLLVIDDRFLRVGSSNLNNRSMGADTECDLAIEGVDAASRARILAVRDRLLAELLGRPRHAVAAACRSAGLIAAIEALNDAGRLREMPALRESGPQLPLPGTALLDPDAPISLRDLWRGASERARRGAAGAKLAPRPR